MLTENEQKNLKKECIQWLEKYMKLNIESPVKEVHKAGKAEGFTKMQIKAARAYEGKFIITAIYDDVFFWRWNG